MATGPGGLWGEEGERPCTQRTGHCVQVEHERVKREVQPGSVRKTGPPHVVADDPPAARQVFVPVAGGGDLPLELDRAPRPPRHYHERRSLPEWTEGDADAVGRRGILDGELRDADCVSQRQRGALPAQQVPSAGYGTWNVELMS